jgi:hypothetical protein
MSAAGVGQAIAQWRKWLAWGSGVGIEIGEPDLTVVAARVRPRGVRIPGVLSVHGFRKEPAAEWGSVYNSFLRKLGLGHLSAVVLLPRHEVTVRQVPLPGIAQKDMEAALALQVDSMHPYPEDDVYWGWAPVAGHAAALVGIVRRDVLDAYTALFTEAGVRVAAFTFAASAMYGASRLLARPKPEGAVALRQVGGAVEIYGESPARGVWSAVVEGSPEQARALAVSELRLEPATEAVDFAGLLPTPLASPGDFDVPAGAAAHAAALESACPKLAPPLNLLPQALRQTDSRALFIPTAALAALVLVLAGALGISAAMEKHRYDEELAAEIRQATLQANHERDLDRKIAETEARVRALDAFRARSKESMDTLAELTRILAPPTWLRGIDMNGREVQIGGDTTQAAALLKLLDASPKFHNSEFTMPLARVGNMETFRIRTYRKGVNP